MQMMFFEKRRMEDSKVTSAAGKHFPLRRETAEEGFEASPIRQSGIPLATGSNPTVWTSRRPLSHDQATVIRSQHRIKIIKSALAFLIIVICFFSLVIPLFLVRITARYWVNLLLSRHVVTQIENVVSAIESVMTKYEMVSEFLENTHTNPPLIQCSPDSVLPLVKYAKSVTDFLGPPPSRYFLAQTSSVGEYQCQLDINESNSSRFDLYFFWNEHTDSIYGGVYNEATNFSDRDFKDAAVTIGPLPISTFNFSRFGVFDGTYWTQSMEVMGSTLFNQPELNAFTPHYAPDGTVIAATGISLPIRTMYEVVDRAKGRRLCHFAIISPIGVIIEDSIGIIRPMFYSDWMPVYPQIGELNSSEWGTVEQGLHTAQEGVPVRIEIGDEQFLAAWKFVIPRQRHPTHTVFMYFSLDEPLADCFIPTSFIFACSMVVGGILVIIGLKLLKANAKRREEMLLSQRANITAGPSTASDGDGVLCKSAQKLRHLQLLYPDDVILNRVIDVVVQNMTEHRHKGYFLGRDETCALCEHLVTPTHTESSTYWKQNAMNSLRRLPSLSRMYFLMTVRVAWNFSASSALILTFVSTW
jgi:hypothetical protein